MLKLFKQTCKKVIERFERMQESKREKTKQEILDNISLMLLQLRTAALDDVDLKELEEAEDAISIVFNSNCK